MLATACKPSIHNTAPMLYILVSYQKTTKVVIKEITTFVVYYLFNFYMHLLT